MDGTGKDFLVTGKIRTSYGVKGYMKVLSYSGDKDHFSGLDTVTLRCNEREYRKKIENVRSANKDILIKFEGIDTPEEAQKYRNCEILIPRENASKCREGEFFYSRS